MKKIKSTFHREDQRGVFDEYVNGPTPWKSVNGGQMNAGAVMGNHYHKKCNAFFMLLSGSAQIIALDARDPKKKKTRCTIKKLQGVLFEPYEAHAIKFLEPSSFLLLKSAQFSEKNKDLHPIEPHLA